MEDAQDAIRRRQVAELIYLLTVALTFLTSGEIFQQNAASFWHDFDLCNKAMDWPIQLLGLTLSTQPSPFTATEPKYGIEISSNCTYFSMDAYSPG